MFDSSSSRCKPVLFIACLALTVVALEGSRDPLLAQRAESTHRATPAHAERRSVRIGESSLGYVNVRQKPDIDSRVIGKVRPGERYGSSRTRDGWVWLDEKQGWIADRYVLASSRLRDEPETARESTAKRDPNQGAATAGLATPRGAPAAQRLSAAGGSEFREIKHWIAARLPDLVYSSSVQRSTGGKDWSTNAVVEASFDGCSLRVTESSIKTWSFSDMGGDSKLTNYFTIPLGRLVSVSGVLDQRNQAIPNGTVSPSTVSVLQLRAATPVITFHAVGESRSYGARAELNKSTSIDESKDERGLDLWSGDSAIVARLEKAIRRAVELCGAKLDPY